MVSKARRYIRSLKRKFWLWVGFNVDFYKRLEDAENKMTVELGKAFYGDGKSASFNMEAALTDDEPIKKGYDKS